jgi:hypothetical protein
LAPLSSQCLPHSLPGCCPGPRPACPPFLRADLVRATAWPWQPQADTGRPALRGQGLLAPCSAAQTTSASCGDPLPFSLSLPHLTLSPASHLPFQRCSGSQTSTLDSAQPFLPLPVQGGICLEEGVWLSSVKRQEGGPATEVVTPLSVLLSPSSLF